MKADDCICTPSDRNDLPEVAEIVGGKKAKKGEFPWQVGLKSPWSKTPWCGGTLISDEWVLTAAHCTQGSASDMEVMIEVIIGKRTNLKHNLGMLMRLLIMRTTTVEHVSTFLRKGRVKQLSNLTSYLSALDFCNSLV